MSDPRSARRQLDRWAVSQGFASFDVYLQAGGSFLGAAAEMRREQKQLDSMLAYIANFSRRPEPQDTALRPFDEAQDQDSASQPQVGNGDPTVDPDALARLEAEHSDDEPGDPANAQIQGAEHRG